MYKIIGSDGKEYGPVSADELRKWIAQGRVSAQTKIQAEGTIEWKLLSEFPEFMYGAAPAMPGTAAMPVNPTSLLSGASMVSGPATGLMVTAIIGLLYQAASIVMNLMGFGASMAGSASAQIPSWVTAMSGTLGIVFSTIGIAMSVLILVGAMKMKKLESYTLAMAVSIIAAVPCFSPCCLLGLPIGIWAIVMLLKPEVKDAFRQNAPLA